MELHAGTQRSFLVCSAIMKSHWNPENNFRCSMRSVSTLFGVSQSDEKEPEYRDAPQIKMSNPCSMITRRVSRIAVPTQVFARCHRREASLRTMVRSTSANTDRSMLSIAIKRWFTSSVQQLERICKQTRRRDPRLMNPYRNF